MLALAALVLTASAVPNIDQPVRSGSAAPADAAVVIGIEDYFVAPDVPFAERDALAFHDFLRYTRGVPAEHLQLLTETPSREKMLQAVESAASEVEEGGTLWIYFAGHGAAASESAERLLLGVDVQSDPTTFETRGLTVPDLRAIGVGSAASSVILVLDTCYAGTGRDGSELAPGKRFMVPTYAKPEGEVAVWTAAGPDQLSGPLDAAEHGAFTWAVIGALRGWADGELNGAADGQVTLDEADAWVSRALRTIGVRDQQPSLSAEDGARSWVMAQGKLEAEPDLSGRAVAALPPASSGAAPAVVRYDIGLEVVLDRATGLEWYRFLQTSSKNSKLVKLCRSMRAASGGWRMPTQAELLTLLEPDKQIGGENPAMVDRVAFPEIREGSLGISTSEMRNKESRWEIDFGRGKADSAHISYGGSTYCVRGEVSPTVLTRFAPTPPPPPLTTTGAIVDETSGPKPIKSGSSPPFVVEPEVASDASTGLIWLRKPQKFEHHQDFVDKLCWDNTSAGGGWRPPSIIELATLLNPDKKGPDEYDPMIDRAVFSDIRSGHIQVGARDPASGTNQRALLAFHDGETSTEHMTWGGQTLCVRGGDAVERPRPPVSSAAFEVSEAVVRDSRSGLVWQRSDSKATLTYTAAEDYCPKLSLEGLSWRMPQHDELQDLVELGRGAPTIDTAVFPHAASQAYWIEETENGRHAVEFAFGGLNSKGESETCRVRCVSP